MATTNTFKTDLYNLFNYTQNTLITYPKELLIEELRNFFAEDSYYRYIKDQFGFPQTPDLTNAKPDTGINDNISTRIFIGEPYRKDVIFYPAILVRHGGARSVPISFSRDRDVVQWDPVRYVDGYGNQKIVSTPIAFVQSGAWEGSIIVDLETRSPRSRDELTELISIDFVDRVNSEMKTAGVYIKGTSPSIGSPSETDDRNDKLYKVSLTFEVRTEWSRKIPINDTVDAINICVDFGNLSTDPPKIATDLSINTNIQLIDALAGFEIG